MLKFAARAPRRERGPGPPGPVARERAGGARGGAARGAGRARAVCGEGAAVPRVAARVQQGPADARRPLPVANAEHVPARRRDAGAGGRVATLGAVLGLWGGGRRPETF